MATIQLSDFLFVEIGNGDLFIYKYDDGSISIKEVENNIIPPINEYTIEILSFYSERHFIFKRYDKSYWWEEIKY